MYLAVSIFLLYLPFSIILNTMPIEFFFIKTKPNIGVVITLIASAWVQWTIRQFPTAYSRKIKLAILIYSALMPLTYISVAPLEEFLILSNNMPMAIIFWLNSVLIAENLYRDSFIASLK